MRSSKKTASVHFAFGCTYRGTGSLEFYVETCPPSSRVLRRSDRVYVLRMGLARSSLSAERVVKHINECLAKKFQKAASNAFLDDGGPRSV